MEALARRFMEFIKDYRPYFNVARRNVSNQARCYMAGLLMKAPRKNMERMQEYVAEYDYESQQHFLSESPWDHRALIDAVAGEVSESLGGADSGLLIDESGFGKKGDKSVGVARQWNGRLGKVDNCQVGVFAALSDGKHCGLIGSRLYLPESWVEDEQRCIRAKIPEDQREYRSKGQLALELIRDAVENKIKFGWIGFDAFYGATPWLLREIEGMGLTFIGDVKSNQTIYTEDPRPYLPRRKNGMGPKIRKRIARRKGVKICEFFGESDLPWEKVEIRQGTKGTLSLEASRKRIWLWDGEEAVARCWWAVCTLDPASDEVKFFLSNAGEEAPLEELVRRHATRYWIERGFQDAKTSLGMGDYQARGWPAWHHHMAMVMLALLFMIKERRTHLQDVELLSCQDLVELLNVLLPRNDLTYDAVLRNISRRHRKRRDDIDSARRRQEAEAKRQL